MEGRALALHPHAPRVLHFITLHPNAQQPTQISSWNHVAALTTDLTCLQFVDCCLPVGTSSPAFAPVLGHLNEVVPGHMYVHLNLSWCLHLCLGLSFVCASHRIASDAALKGQ